MPSDSHGRLEPKLLRAVEQDQVPAVQEILNLARENGQFGEKLLRIGLMRGAERGSVYATEYLLSIIIDESAQQQQPLPPQLRQLALLKAVEHNRVQIVKLLLDRGGASPHAIVDGKGRTLLMTAAWKGSTDVLRFLISRGADVDARDYKKRSVLHNLAADKTCKWKEDVVELLLLLSSTDCKIDGRDELGRTPLHWACATGKLRFAEMLLTTRAARAKARRPKADVNAVEARSKTALHIAAAYDRPELVKLLLAHNADINARSDGGWTPLHNACDKGIITITRVLLDAGANINSQLLNGATPLHLAAQAGHFDIVKSLLAQPAVKRRIRDNFGNTPFLRAVQFRRKDIVLLLAPYNNVDALSEDARGASEAFEATIVDFGNFRNENRVRKMSVFWLLYGRDEERLRKTGQGVDTTTTAATTEATETTSTTTPTTATVLDDATAFRWIHLPANNMTWVEALLTKAFIEDGKYDVDGFKGLERSFNCQHRGQRVHSHFMRPLCHSTPRSMGPKPGDSSSGRSPQGTGSKNAQSPESVSNSQKSPGRSLERVDTSQSNGHGNPQVKKGKGATKRGNSGNTNGILSRTTPELKDRPLTLPNSSMSTLSSYNNKGTAGHMQTFNICLFMPYLHFESTEGTRKMQEAIQAAVTLNNFDPGSEQSRHRHGPRSRDEMLIRAHLNSSTTSLHVRRTLDQFFYPNIDTQTRDQDQVVYRYQMHGHGRGRSWTSDPKIFMVDQLWMWILGKNLIVTSFPERWEQPKNDPLNVLDGIIRDINSKTREPVQSVYDLAMVITNRCSGVFDRHRMGDEEYQFLDMFESSIGTATDRETKLFQVFNEASSQASHWLKYHHESGGGGRRHSESGPLEYTDEHEAKSAQQERTGQHPLFIDKLLDIGQETDLLAEARDIRDELNMIRTVLHHQQHILSDFQDVLLLEIYQGNQTPQRRHREIKKRLFKDQQRTIDMHLKDIDRMDAQATRIYSSITDLLDLKQKHANALEARFARDQALDTTRQGKTIMMFTIVTIIFLPLSFIISIFTVNIAEFPRAEDGSESLPLAYVAKYTFGIGFAISIPLIVVALLVDDIGGWFWVGVGRVRRWVVLRSRRNQNRNQRNQRNQSQFHQSRGLSTSSSSSSSSPPWPSSETTEKNFQRLEILSVARSWRDRRRRGGRTRGRGSIDTGLSAGSGSLVPFSSMGSSRANRGHDAGTDTRNGC